MSTYHIHINGMVQGVGFRPMIYLIAKDMKLQGYVKNGSDGVHIFFNSSEVTAYLFFEKIKQSAPPQSKIISSGLYAAVDAVFDDFSIILEEGRSTGKQVLISPDIAICSSCRAELHDVTNRRYRYPFITCTQCGPRYSIINEVPYERHATAMQKFTMCKRCKSEYDDTTDTRFFSQTNSCNDCGIKLSIHESDGSVLTSNTENVLLHIKNFLAQGKIITVKGIGGYLLLCAASNAAAIQLLRSRKHRPSKPFAVLYPGIEQVRHDFKLNKQEKELLLSAEAPIVLLYPEPGAFDNLAIKSIAPGLNRIGVMFPYNPLLELISGDYGKPLIATSANISGSPILYKDEDALANLFVIADTLISYNREILIPEDDSVVQVSKHSKQQVILRRSRGYAPSFFQYKPKIKKCVLATGAFLKSSFTLSVNGNVFVSQFLGSGESFESQQMYRNTLDHWLNMYDIQPDDIVADKHPGYFSHQHAIELAKKLRSDITFVQHHQAHFVAVMAENNLINTEEAVLGVIWDGTGLGDDGNIWGGEFFRYQNKEMLRCYHFDYFPVIAGDKLALEPRIAALCATADVWPQLIEMKEKFTETEWNNYQVLIQSTNLFSSSVGRIFDAVASLLSICDKQSYEGEAAMYLQALAEEYIDAKGFDMNESYFKKDSHYYRIPTASLLQGIIMDIKKGKAKNYIAAKFHYSLVCLIDIVAQHLNVTKICFSGGVFQNALLVDWIEIAYCNKYQLSFHKYLSPNDENISFGQFVYYENDISSIRQTDLQAGLSLAVK